MTDRLEAFVDHYNTQRPHQALNDRTPAQVHADTPPARPDPAGTLHKRSRRMVNHTQGNGNLGYASWQIGLGRAHPNTVVAITDHGDLIEIHDEHGTLCTCQQGLRTRVSTTSPDRTPVSVVMRLTSEIRRMHAEHHRVCSHSKVCSQPQHAQNPLLGTWRYPERSG